MSCGLHLDESLSPMEEKRFKAKHSSLIQRLVKELPFSYNEIESLLLIYFKFQLQSDKAGGMTTLQLKEVLHNGLDLTDLELVDPICTAVEFERSVNHVFTMESWVRTFALFLRGTMEEKMKYCFSVYSMMNDGVLTRHVVCDLLKNSLIGEAGEDVEDCVKDLTEMMILKMDLDRDGRVSFDDYKHTVQKQPLYLEAFGQCLPSRMAVQAFLTTFTPYIGNVVK